MGTKKVNYNEKEIEKLPNDKPVLYRIQTKNGNPNYIGTAKRGRVQERILEHLGKIPGSKVKIEQFHSIEDAQKKEGRAIKINQLKFNEQSR